MSRRQSVKKKTNNVDEKKKAVIYCRVSTSEQGESGLSLDHQESRCRLFCEARDWEIYNSYIEIASASNVDRPELQNLLSDINNNEIDVVVALRLDRISRVPRDFFNLIDDLNKLEISVCTVENDVDTTTAQGRMLVGVLIQFASFEREINSERTKAAMREKAIRGEPRGGLPPYGYDVEDKNYIVNNGESKNVLFIFKEYLKGSGASEIARRLNEKGLRTKIHVTKKGMRRGGKIFTRNIIGDMLNNPIYTGKIYSSGEIFEGKHEAIIDEKTYDRVQLMRKENSKFKNLGKSIKGQMLLNGLIKCANCERYMTTASGTGRDNKVYYYYKCTKSVHEGSGACKSSQIKKEDIEYLIKEIIRKVCTDKMFFNNSISFIKENNLGKNKDLHSDLNEFIVKRKQLEEEQKQLFITMSQQKLDDVNAVSELIRDKDQQFKELQSTIESLKDEIKMVESTNLDEHKLFEIYKEFYSVWNELDLSDQRDLISLIVKEVNVNCPKGANEGEIKITYGQKYHRVC
jgi:site-specific DNA recombinase